MTSPTSQVKRLFIILFLLAATSVRAVAQMTPEEHLYASVLMLEGKSRQERQAYIEDELKKIGVSYFSVPFDSLVIVGQDTLNLGGVNIVARIGRGPKRVVVAAHYDAIPGSPGANDNGSGVAVLLELVRALKDRAWNYSFDFCFFDQEENGLLGSKRYVRGFVVPRLHLAMVNLDVEGLGDELYVGPAGRWNERFLLPLARKAADSLQLSLQDRTAYPMSDYASFGSAGLENISISVVPKGDADRLAGMLERGGSVSASNMPEVMKVIHTHNDLAKYVSVDALKLSFEYTQTLLVLIDDSGKPKGK
jgi:hypothetical protein